MSEPETLPELKQILGALVLGADRSLSVKEMRQCLKDVAEQAGGVARAFKDVKESDIRAALDQLGRQVLEARCGFALAEVANGFRFQSDPSCGRWMRHLLQAGKPHRLSWPALETLSIIAYRQPVSRAGIEAVRGVNVDYIIKSLMEMQLIRIVGRSELPGRPFLYGTSHSFLEHFGLKNVDELGDLNPALLRAGKQPARAAAPAAAESAA
ncbi:MAG: SMC-Scp complex subunit ScpB, partial [Verrucomicrobiota bacterium]|nr:SMC-Scp complex subunit ScpB [Verrucomicrobiota bacterium]